MGDDMSKYIEYLDETIRELKETEKELVQTDRKDEANIIRIKMNICDIAKTIYNVSAKKNSGSALKEEYVRQLTRLPENWKVSYQKAKEHGDVQKILIEETKLEMLQMIKDKFENLGECE